MNTSFLVLLIIAIFLIVIICVLWFLRIRGWPIKFILKNNSAGSTIVEVYMNETQISESPFTISAENNRVITLSGQNPRTYEEYKRDQVQSIAVHLLSPSDITFSSINVPTHTAVYASSLSGLAPIDTNPGYRWTKPGYYVITFTRGIPIV